MTRAGPTLAALLLFAPSAVGQVQDPPPPAKYDVQIRYRLGAGRDERAKQYRELEARLTSLGFVRTRRPGDDLDILDPNAERFQGTLPPAAVLRLLDDPKIQTVLFQPAPVNGGDPPPAPAASVVRVGIPGGLQTTEQLKFHRQVVAQLGRLGFVEASGYDTRAPLGLVADGQSPRGLPYTLIRGTLPGANVPKLLKDIRREPAGWFLADTPVDLLPSPLNAVLPVKWVELLGAAPAVERVADAVPPGQSKYTPDLRAEVQRLRLVARQEQAAVNGRIARLENDVKALDAVRDREKLLKGEASRDTDDQLAALRRQIARLRRTAAELEDPPVRVEFVAPGRVDDKPDDLRTKVTAAVRGASLEGAVGSVYAVRFTRTADAEKYAADPAVLVARLPRASVETFVPAPANPELPAADQVLADTRLGYLHSLGYRGRGVKVVVIGSDFSGLVRLFGAHVLPGSPPTAVTYLDLTAELDPNLDAAPADYTREGNGVTAAKLVRFAAPAAELVLVRVDPASLFQVMSVAKYVRGDASYSDALRSRVEAFSVRSTELANRRQAVGEEYRQAIANPSDDERPRARRDAARVAIDTLLEDEAELSGAAHRFDRLQNKLSALTGARVVFNTLCWETGYPLDGLGDLSRLIDSWVQAPANRITRPTALRADRKVIPVWVQPASGSGHAVWGGPFRDADGNGVMEFVPATQAVGVGGWSRELNFVGTRLAAGGVQPAVPAGTRVRLVIQWREPHDPVRNPEHRSVLPLVLRVFQQDSSYAESFASDALTEVARSGDAAYPLYRQPTFAVFEQVVEFDLPKTARLAVAVEVAPTPPAALPGAKTRIEVYPRLHVQAVSSFDPNAPPANRVYTPRGDRGERLVFRSFAEPVAGVGMPGDAVNAVTVGGTADPNGPIARGMAGGGLVSGGTGITLRPKPNVLALDEFRVGGMVQRGPGLAAGFTAGLAACLVEGGATGPTAFPPTLFRRARPSRCRNRCCRHCRPSRSTTRKSGSFHSHRSRQAMTRRAAGVSRPGGHIGHPAG